MRGLLALLASLAFVGCSTENRPYKIVADTIPHALSDEAGNIDNGKALFVARESGHCVLCHQATQLDAEFQGNLGPDLSNVGDRLSLPQLRLRLVDYEAYRPGTVMPSYFRTHNLNQVGEPYKKQTVLSAQDIEDIIAYLSNLKGETAL